MKESIEQFKKKEEKSVLEEIWEIKKREEAIKEEDPRYGTPWNVINPDKLIPESLRLFSLYLEKNLDAAKPDVRAIREKIETIKDRETRENNRQFIKWLDDKIGSEFLRNQLRSEREQDNTR